MTEDHQSIEADAEVGRVLNDLYKIERRIGSGGMGVVYEARHLHLNKLFAVKVLADSVASSPSAVERLWREAKAASSIDNDHIVNISHLDRTDTGEVFVVMERLYGESLAQRLSRGPLAWQDAVGIALQVANALQTAHDNGIVHRDLKPANVFLVEKKGRDFVKVLDFGTSKVLSADAEQISTTRSDQLIGTPLYMSPEQARGEPNVDRRADVYALGLILYEMLTGRPPFDGANYFQVIWKHSNEEPPRLSGDFAAGEPPAAIESCLQRALAKEPAQRFESMDAMAKALETSLPATGRGHRNALDQPPPATATRPRRRRLLLGSAALVGLVAAVYLVWWPASPPSKQDSAAERTPRPTPAPQKAVMRSAKHDSPNASATPEPKPAAMRAAAQQDKTPPKVRLSFRSTPSGARVRVGDAVLGRTPLDYSAPRSTQPLDVVVSRKGFLPSRFKVTPNDNQLLRATLRKRHDPTDHELPFKTQF